MCTLQADVSDFIVGSDAIELHNHAMQSGNVWRKTQHVQRLNFVTSSDCPSFK